MDEASISRYITDTFAGTEVVVASGNSFFCRDSDHTFPFATFVTTDDDYDRLGAATETTT